MAKWSGTNATTRASRPTTATASNIRAQRNLLASNIGLIAKRGSKGKLLVVATALDSAKPLSGVNINAISYQNQLHRQRPHRWRWHAGTGRRARSRSR